MDDYATYLAFFKSPVSDLWWVRDDCGHANTYTSLELALFTTLFGEKRAPHLTAFGDGFLIIELKRSDTK